MDDWKVASEVWKMEKWRVMDGRLKSGGWEKEKLKSRMMRILKGSYKWISVDKEMAGEGWKNDEWWMRKGKIEVADDEDIERLLQ